MPTSPSVLPESPAELAVSTLGPSAATCWVAWSNRGPSRPTSCEISVRVGSLAGNSTFRGSLASSKVVGPEVKLWSTCWLPMEPKKWNVYLPGAVGKNHAR